MYQAPFSKNISYPFSSLFFGGEKKLYEVFNFLDIKKCALKIEHFWKAKLMRFFPYKRHYNEHFQQTAYFWEVKLEWICFSTRYGNVKRLKREVVFESLVVGINK